MRLIAIAKLRKAAFSYPDVSNQIEDFYQTIKTVHWQNLIDVQKTFSTAEAVGTLDSSFKSGNPPNGLSRKAVFARGNAEETSAYSTLAARVSLIELLPRVSIVHY